MRAGRDCSLAAGSHIKLEFVVDLSVSLLSVEFELVLASAVRLSWCPKLNRTHKPADQVC